MGSSLVRAAAKRRMRLGFFAAVVSAVGYAVTVVVGRRLASRGIDGAAALGTRFGIAAVALVALQALRRAPLAPPAGERLRVLLLGGIGYGIESSCFYAALGRGSAGAVSLLFYSYPAMVLLSELLLRQLRPSLRLLAAVVLSIVGTALIVTAGGDVTISATGAALAVTAAVAFTVYFLLSHRLVTRTDPVVNATWVSAGAALAMAVRGAVTDGLAVPTGNTALLVGYGIAGAVAFGGMFLALPRLGPSRTAVVLTFETLATVALAALWLDERLHVIQLVGGVGIAAGAVLAAVAGAPVVEPEP